MVRYSPSWCLLSCELLLLLLELLLLLLLIRWLEVIRWLRVRLAFALVRATNVCVRGSTRGSRTKWRSLGLEDGAAVPFD